MTTEQELLSRGLAFVRDLLSRNHEIGTFEVELELKKHRLAFVDAESIAGVDGGFMLGVDTLLDLAKGEARWMREGLKAEVEAISVDALESLRADIGEGD